jgi:hypothetical protein
MTDRLARRARLALLLALAATGLARGAEPADSGRLLVEVIVFRQPGAPGAAVKSEAPGDSARQTPLAGLDVALNRRGYTVLGHGSWVVSVAPNSTATTNLEGLMPGAPVTGKVSITRGQILFLKLDARDTSEGSAALAHINERRRIKFGERHYFDGAELSAVASVVPVRGSAAADDAAARQNE